MRIAQVMAGAPAGGAELFFERLCIALHQAGETVLPVIRTEPARAARLREAGLAPESLAFGGPLDIVTRPRLARLLRGFAPDVAVSWMSRATWHMPRGKFVHVARLGGYYPLKYYRRADHLVGNTEGIVAWLRANGWPAERTHYLPNFVTDFAATAPAEEFARGEPMLLALGRLHRDKAFDVLIRALALVPRARLVIAGAGPEGEALAAIAREEGVAGRVHLIGWRQDVGALLKAADLFVCSSRVEPLGNVVLEAWSAGCAVVAADADGPRELIRPGIDGLVCPREDAVALAEAIRTVLGDITLARRLAAAGRARFAAEFAAAPVLAQWRRFLGDVAARR